MEVDNNKNDRILLLYGDVNSEMTEKASEKLITWQLEDVRNAEHIKDYIPEPIRVFINSYGGNASDAFTIAHILESMDAEVMICCNGVACSAGFLILIAGDYRVIHAETEILYHEASWEISGKITNISSDAERAVRLQNMINSYVLRRTSIPEDILKQINNKQLDKWFSLEELIEYKIVDEIIGLDE